MVVDTHLAEFLVLGLGALSQYAVEIGGSWSDATVRFEINPGNETAKMGDMFVGEWRFEGQLEQIRGSNGVSRPIIVDGTVRWSRELLIPSNESRLRDCSGTMRCRPSAAPSLSHFDPMAG